MFIKINTKQLKTYINYCLLFIAKHSTLPILSNILFEIKDNKLFIKATDMDKYIIINNVDCELHWLFSFTVDWNLFNSILNNIKSDDVILDFIPEKDLLIIKANKDKFEIRTLSSVEYVSIPEIPSTDFIELNNNKIVDWIKKIKSCISSKNFAPVLTGMFLNFDNKNIVLVWTDSFVLWEYTIETTKINNLKLIIPIDNINSVIKIVEEELKFSNIKNVSDNKNIIYYTDNLIKWSLNNIDIICTIIQWDYPAYSRVIPDSFDYKFIVNKNILLEWINKCNIISKDVNFANTFILDNNKITIKSFHSEKWNITTDIEIDNLIVDNEITLNINTSYLINIIKNIYDNLIIEYNIEKNLIKITDELNNNYLYILRCLENK